ncbi:MAG TPA: hypothetical protein DHW82_01690 [Spirochaetia bacterium]|nr:MAG: hypothetical protein A2Y41_10175 [Spirochaetes bacterium GWB1_36_13]HCL55707.1 hypothetical protein [Spirochaetia bacterium]
MYCPQCGKSNEQEARFCTSCGNSLNQNRLPLQQRIPRSAGKKANFMLLLIFFVLGIAGVLAGAYILVEHLVYSNFLLSPENLNPTTLVSALLFYLLGFGFLITFFVFFMIYIYRSWDLIQDEHSRVTPGIAVGFLFIPFYNFYWVFKAYYGWALDYNYFIERNKIEAAPVSEKLFLLNCLLPIFIFILNLYFLSHLTENQLFILSFVSLFSLTIHLMMIAQITKAINILSAWHLAKKNK